MERSIYEEAAGVGNFVMRKILSLQDGNPAKAPDSSSARASLARLRKLGNPGSSWLTVGSEVFSGWPELQLSERDEGRMARAIAGALRLYAYHQQSKRVSMALGASASTEEESKPDSHQRSFGWSCWALEPDQEQSQGVRRRMANIEAASDFDGVEYNVRALVLLMRAKDVKVDYWLLARDLYLIQFESARDKVFMRWARDYYGPKKDSGVQLAEDSASKDKKD